ncbi:MAG: putative Zn-dependent protease [bacterium]|jgi:predicted Zn-dependent protease
MNQSQYDGAAFHPKLPKGRASGTIKITSSTLAITLESQRQLFDLRKIKITKGGANNRLIFFKHPHYPEWSIYTSDTSILKNEYLQKNENTASQIQQIQGKKRKSLLITTIILFLILASFGSLFLLKNPIVTLIASQIPPAWEVKIGKMIVSQILVSKKVIRDPKLLAQLKKITQPIVKSVQPSPYPFKFHIIQDPTLNAFAVPGGNIVIHSGLLLEAGRSEELAGVLAHEIAHITRKHSLRNILSTAGTFLILQTFLGDFTGLIGVVAEGGGYLLRQKYSRDYEREADQFGWKYLEKANINPSGMIDFFKRVLQKEKELTKKSSIAKATKSLSFLGTHPQTKKRIDRLTSKWNEMKNKTGFYQFSIDWKRFQQQLLYTLKPEARGGKTE